MKFNPDIIRSERKSLSIEVRPDGKVTVRAPLRMSYREIEAFITSHSDKIEKMIEKQNGRLAEASALPPYTEEELREAKERALKEIPPRVAYYADILGVTYGKITIRTPKTRWGSCTSKGNLNFSALLALMPPEIMDSVILHELCHRKEMNHSKRFYDEILKIMPDYYERDRWLKDNGYKYSSRLPG